MLYNPSPIWLISLDSSLIVDLSSYFEYFFLIEWINSLNEYLEFSFELNIELNDFLALFNVWMNNQNLSPRARSHRYINTLIQIFSKSSKSCDNDGVLAIKVYEEKISIYWYILALFSQSKKHDIMTVFFDDDDHDDAAQSPPWTFAIKVYEAKRGMRKHLVHEMQTNFNWINCIKLI